MHLFATTGLRIRAATTGLRVPPATTGLRGRPAAVAGLRAQPADADRRVTRPAFVVGAAPAARPDDAHRRQRHQATPVIELAHLVEQAALLRRRRAQLP